MGDGLVIDSPCADRGWVVTNYQRILSGTSLKFLVPTTMAAFPREGAQPWHVLEVCSVVNPKKIKIKMKRKRTARDFRGLEFARPPGSPYGFVLFPPLPSDPVHRWALMGCDLLGSRYNHPSSLSHFLSSDEPFLCLVFDGQSKKFRAPLQSPAATFPPFASQQVQERYTL